MFCNERPIFGLKCPFRSVQYPDGRVLGSLCGKMAQNMFSEGHKYLRIFLGGGMPPLSLGAPTFCSIYAILGKIKGPLEGGEASQPPKKILCYLRPS